MRTGATQHHSTNAPCAHSSNASRRAHQGNGTLLDRISPVQVLPVRVFQCCAAISSAPQPTFSMADKSPASLSHPPSDFLLSLNSSSLPMGACPARRRPSLPCPHERRPAQARGPSQPQAKPLQAGPPPIFWECRHAPRRSSFCRHADKVGHGRSRCRYGTAVHLDAEVAAGRKPPSETASP